MQPLLSIVMASHKDRSGVWSTLVELVQTRADLGLVNEIEIVCLANDAEGPILELKRRDFADIPNSKLVHWPERIGTAAAKNKAISEASGQAFVCLDCHVFLRTGVLAKLVDFWRSNTDSKDLYFGPNLHRRVVDEHGKPAFVGTHMSGGWGTDGSFGTWAVHPPALEPDAQPFEIALSGCGLFSGWKANWLGFSDRLRGFGPEECNIAGRYRKAGNKLFCLPWLQWIHRYGHNPEDAPGYENLWWNRALGNLVTWQETGYPNIRNSNPVLDIKRAHVRKDRLTEQQWLQLCAELKIPDPGPLEKKKPTAPEVVQLQRSFPPLNATDANYREQLPCRHRGEQQAVLKCNRGCPSSQQELWAGFECRMRGQIVTLGKRRTDFQNCLECPERTAQQKPEDDAVKPAEVMRPSGPVGPRKEPPIRIPPPAPILLVRGG